MIIKKPTPTFVIHREGAGGWRSTFDGGTVASSGAATHSEVRKWAEVTIRAALGPEYVACNHQAISCERTAGGSPEPDLPSV